MHTTRLSTVSHSIPGRYIGGEYPPQGVSTHPLDIPTREGSEYPPPMDRQRPVKTLPSLQLRLKVVIMGSVFVNVMLTLKSKN